MPLSGTTALMTQQSVDWFQFIVEDGCWFLLGLPFHEQQTKGWYRSNLYWFHCEAVPATSMMSWSMPIYAPIEELGTYRLRQFKNPASYFWLANQCMSKPGSTHLYNPHKWSHTWLWTILHYQPPLSKHTRQEQPSGQHVYWAVCNPSERPSQGKCSSDPLFKDCLMQLRSAYYHLLSPIIP